MDHRVKSGGDEAGEASTACASSAARMPSGAVLWRKRHKPRGREVRAYLRAGGVVS
jgi:hypothetical protein